MGVKGAALATVISQACSAAWVLSFLFSRKFNKAPIKTEHMAMAGRPCALIKEFSPVEISTKTVPTVPHGYCLSCSPGRLLCLWRGAI